MPAAPTARQLLLFFSTSSFLVVFLAFILYEQPGLGLAHFFYLSIALRLDARLVGLTMSVGSLVAALTGFPAGRVVDRFGARRATLVGLAGIAAAALVLAIRPERLGVPGYIAPMAALTASYALFQAANNTGVMQHVPPEARGVVAGTLGLSRNLGLVTGTCVMGAVFALGAGASDITAAPPDAVARGMRISYALAAALIALAFALIAATATTATATTARKA